MMFRKPNQEPDYAQIESFIEKPYEICTEEERQEGISSVLFLLNKNPIKIIDIISNHLVISANFLLDELVDKMKKLNCIESLNVLFDEHIDSLTEACIFNLADLKRCIEAMPSYEKKIIESIIHNKTCFKRLLEADQHPLKTLNEIISRYPHYQIQFSAFYNQNYNSTPTLKRI